MLIVTACLLAAAGVWYAKHRLDNIETIALDNVLTDKGADAAGASSEFPTEVENYLIVGSDSRDGASPDDPDYMGIVGTEDHVGRRSDTIMLMRFDPVTNSAALLSLPRDLYVDIPGSDDRNRINAAFFKGPDVLIKTVTESFGIPVHHYVEVDFQGFKRIVDAIDGVAIWFDAPVRDAQHRPAGQRDRLREARRAAGPRSTPGHATSRRRSTDGGGRTRPATSGASAASRTSSGGPCRRPSPGARATRSCSTS